MRLCCLDARFVGRALDGVCVGMILTNPAGRVLWMNRSARAMLGVRDEGWEGQLLGQGIRDPRLAEFWHRAQEAGEQVLGEVSLHWPRVTELKVNYTQCIDPDGCEVGRAVLFCDVTRERTLQLSLSEEATRKLLDLAEGTGRAEGAEAGLTARELSVLGLVGKGFGNQEIAERLHVAPSTVRSHLKSVYRKTGLSSRAEAIACAIQHQL